MASSACFEPVSKLHWPSTETRSAVQCAGCGYLGLLKARRSPLSSLLLTVAASANGAAARSPAGAASPKKKKDRDLLKVRDLSKLNHYEILSVSLGASKDDIKRAYHRACLKYHPDKTGRGEDDEVFLSIKEAHDVLSDEPRRRAYDSSVDFDDSIPKEGVREKKFYKEYAPVFARNLRFAANERKAGRNRTVTLVPPPFGDDALPIDEVNAFYDYWTNFESWRDFSLVAKKATEHDVESAECREEKRWMAKEIDRKARALKREEMARINTLVERAMAADPRLRRHRKFVADEKERVAREKEETAQRERKAAVERQAEEKAEAESRAEAERRTKAEEKAARDADKKVLRKARNGLRKWVLSSSAVTEAWGSLEDADADVELLCEQLTALNLEEMTRDVPAKKEDLVAVRTAAKDAREGRANAVAEKEKERKAAREADQAKKAAEAMAKKREWKEEELAALAKAVRKFPPGGGNRWEAIASYINSTLRLDQPLKKEECIARYNEANVGGPPGAKKTPSQTAAAPTQSSSDWTEEMDKLLQKGLKDNPASMDKNERWSNIARGVPGKNKKECVERFKAIRSALKAKNGN
mmetsp:Transcript_13592/g.29993  ORF Transcript_13592/g.29993 Transcript_13592/m.29993 type:complete len:587 (-) Transcript_13592:124-1884(-)